MKSKTMKLKEKIQKDIESIGGEVVYLGIGVDGKEENIKSINIKYPIIEIQGQNIIEGDGYCLSQHGYNLTSRVVNYNYMPMAKKLKEKKEKSNKED